MKLSILLLYAALSWSQVNNGGIYNPGAGGGGGGSVQPIVTTSTTSPAVVTLTCPISYYYNNSSGAITFTLPTPSSTTTGCSTFIAEASGQSGVITIAAPSGVDISFGGTAGATGGSLVSGGAANDSITLVPRTATEYFAYPYSGVWTPGSSSCAITPNTLGPYTDTQNIGTVTFTSTGSGCAGAWSGSGLPSGLTAPSGSGGTANLTGTVAIGAHSSSPFSVIITRGSTNDPFTLTVNAVPSLSSCGGNAVSGSAVTCPAAASGVAYSAALVSAGGSGSTTYALGGQPGGMTISGSNISWPSPTTGGSPYSFTITPTDANGVSGAAITASLTVGAISPASAGPYTATETITTPTFTCTGCTAASWSVSGVGSSGITIGSSTGIFGGTAGSAGSYGGIVVSYGTVNTPSFSVTINAVPAITACGSGTVSGGAATCDPGTTGVAYSKTITSTGGTGTITFSITSGGGTLTALGLAMSSSGVVSGASPTAGTATFTVVATDSHSIASSGVVMTLVVSGGGGSITIVNATGISSTNAGLSVTATVNCSGANAAIVAVSNLTTAINPNLVDANSNTYTLDGHYAASGADQIWLYRNQGGTFTNGMTFTFNDSVTTNSFPSIVAVCLAGVATSPLDSVNGNNTASGTSLNTGNITIGASDQIWVSAVSIGSVNTGAPWSPGTGTLFSASIGTTSGQAFGIGMAYVLAPSTGAVSDTWSGSTNTAAAVIASYK